MKLLKKNEAILTELLQLVFEDKPISDDSLVEVESLILDSGTTSYDAIWLASQLARDARRSESNVAQICEQLLPGVKIHRSPLYKMIGRLWKGQSTTQIVQKLSTQDNAEIFCSVLSFSVLSSSTFGDNIGQHVEKCHDSADSSFDAHGIPEQSLNGLEL